MVYLETYFPLFMQETSTSLTAAITHDSNIDIECFSLSTKKTKTVDFELNLIYQIGSNQTDYTNYVLNPSVASVEKLKKLITITDV